MAPFNSSATAAQVTAGLDLTGKTILVTGCNSGIGFETMRVLALRGARVLGTARTEAKAQAACARVEGSAIPLVCELSDPQRILALTHAVQEPIDAIIANAGVMALQERELQHGIEAQMFTNHVGHFMLVTGLLDRLNPNGRIVIVASAAHSFARGKGIDFADLGWEKRPYKPWAAYGQSKLANILFAKELAKRLPAGQTANALHPGIIDTPLFRHLPKDEATRMKGTWHFKTIPQGAATQTFLATHPSVATVSGEYFNNCAVSKPTALAQDATLAAKLWDVTEALVAQMFNG